jgi:flagellar motor switch protein FliN/FliY
MADIEDAPQANDEIAAEDADLETASGDQEANIGQEGNVSGTAEHLNAQLEDESSTPDGGLGDDAGVEEALQAWEEGGHVLEEKEDSEQISAVRFAQLEQAVPKVNKKPDLLNNVVVQVSVELGRKDMTVSKLSDLKEQDVIELEKLAGEPFDVRVNGRLFATGEVVVVTDLMAVRITSLYQNPDTQNAERE